MRAELQQRFETGGAVEAALRALVYVRLADGNVDERGFAVMKRIRAAQPAARRLSLARFKELLREQYLLVLLDTERAMAALPKLLGHDEAMRKAMLEALHRVLAAGAGLSGEAAQRLARVEALFGARSQALAKTETAHA